MLADIFNPNFSLSFSNPFRTPLSSNSLSDTPKLTNLQERQGSAHSL
jgi:hypothetical protein